MRTEERETRGLMELESKSQRRDSSGDGCVAHSKRLSVQCRHTLRHGSTAAGAPGKEHGSLWGLGIQAMNIVVRGITSASMYWTASQRGTGCVSARVRYGLGFVDKLRPHSHPVAFLRNVHASSSDREKKASGGEEDLHRGVPRDPRGHPCMRLVTLLINKRGGGFADFPARDPRSFDRWRGNWGR